jgi:hypothetical protein
MVGRLSMRCRTDGVFVVLKGVWIRMKLRLAFACLFLLALMPMAAIAQDDSEEGTGRIYGQVVNGSDSGGDVSGLEVVLTRFQQMDAVETYSTEVDDDGSYEFTDLPIAQDEAYLAHVVYEDIEFRSTMVLLSQDPESEQDITVWEQTDDSSVLRVISRGIVIAEANDELGVIEILEIIALENESDRVFVGDENGEVLRLAMPENASEIAPQPGFEYGQMYFDDQRPNVLVSTGAVHPGSHNPMISYQVPYEGTSGRLSVGTAMPTEMLRVLVREDRYEISSQVLEPAGIQQVGSDNYEVLAIDSPVVGDSFTVEVSGLPRENWNLPVETSTLLASLAAGVGLVIGAVLIYQVVQRRQSMQPATAGAQSSESNDFDEMDSNELEQERIELASDLNKLEADYERGDIDEETYNDERDRILEELRQISLRMRGYDEA